jgi:hypothetical protein
VKNTKGKKGTRMSKEYIKKERALQLLEENASDDEVFFAARAIEAEPPADVKPVVRGEWEIIPTDEDGNPLKNSNNEIYFGCSVCKESVWERRTLNFCPNCGADMRKEGDGDE